MLKFLKSENCNTIYIKWFKTGALSSIKCHSAHDAKRQSKRTFKYLFYNFEEYLSKRLKKIISSTSLYIRGRFLIKFYTLFEAIFFFKNICAFFLSSREEKPLGFLKFQGWKPS